MARIKPTVLAWHFTNGMKLRDGTPLEAGRTYTVKPPLKICERGLHASVLALEALFYAPGTVVSRVRCGGLIVTEGDKLVCSKRTVLWTFDAGDVLMQFARECALDVLDLWDAPKIVREYLETGNKTKAAEAYRASLAARRWPRIRATRAATAATTSAASAATGSVSAATGSVSAVVSAGTATAWATMAKKTTAVTVAAARRRARMPRALRSSVAEAPGLRKVKLARAANNATLESLLISTAIDFGYVDPTTLEAM